MLLRAAVERAGAQVPDGAYAHFRREAHTVIDRPFGISEWFAFDEIAHLTVEHIRTLIGPADATRPCGCRYLHIRIGLVGCQRIKYAAHAEYRMKGKITVDQVTDLGAEWCRA